MIVFQCCQRPRTIPLRSRLGRSLKHTALPWIFTPFFCLTTRVGAIWETRHVSDVFKRVVSRTNKSIEILSLNFKYNYKVVKGVQSWPPPKLRLVFLLSDRLPPCLAPYNIDCVVLKKFLTQIEFASFFKNKLMVTLLASAIASQVSKIEVFPNP